MSSKEDRAIVVTTFIVIALVGVGVILAAISPKTPAVGVMILKADDLQNAEFGYWGQTDYKEFSNRWTPNSTSEAISFMGNGSAQLFIKMAVFANDADCHAFLNDSINLSSLNATDSLIGDEGYWGTHYSQWIVFIFREGRVVASIGLLYSTALGPQAYDHIISIARLQLEKIDQQLAWI